jgi:hypothetical protein
MLRDLTADANSLAFVIVFRCSELAPNVFLEHDSENLIGILLVEIEECWLSHRCIRVSAADHLAACGRSFTEMFLSLRS